jgi:NAD(P)H-hydrate epimerase
VRFAYMRARVMLTFQSFCLLRLLLKLVTMACLRSGVGLLTVHVPFCNNFIVQTSVPEAMTELDISDTCFAAATDTDDYQAVAIGPGLGKAAETEAALLEQIETCQTPMVVDADALNLLGEKRNYIGRLPKGSILTPHPKELERLVGKCQNSYERLMKARELAKSAGVHIILKGAYSAIVTPAGKCFFNPTGNPGMATAGSGDTLTGILVALQAQGYEAFDAARLGVFLHGMAGDIAARTVAFESITAGEIISHLGVAFNELKNCISHKNSSI